MHGYWTKDPQANKDYTFDWWQLTGNPVTDGVATATVTATPAGLTIGSPNITGGGRFVSAFISGGTAGVMYEVLCHVTTVGGRIDESTHSLLVLNE